jgi:hypothetical protein
VLCGNKPQLLKAAIEGAGVRVACACHCGNRGLVGRYAGHAALASLDTGAKRRIKRAELWAGEILAQL